MLARNSVYVGKGMMVARLKVSETDCAVHAARCKGSSGSPTLEGRCALTRVERWSSCNAPARMSCAAWWVCRVAGRSPGYCHESERHCWPAPVPLIGGEGPPRLLWMFTNMGGPRQAQHPALAARAAEERARSAPPTHGPMKGHPGGPAPAHQVVPPRWQRLRPGDAQAAGPWLVGYPRGGLRPSARPRRPPCFLPSIGPALPPATALGGCLGGLGAPVPTLPSACWHVAACAAPRPGKAAACAAAAAARSK
jgi:hypothetical protein